MEPLALAGVSSGDAAPGRAMSGPGSTHVFVEGIVAQRNGEPYVCVTVNGEKAQLSIAEAHKIAQDIVVMAARTEADAMIFKFTKDRGLPETMAAHLMAEFRYFRLRQDRGEVEGTVVDPDSGETIK